MWLSRFLYTFLHSFPTPDNGFLLVNGLKLNLTLSENFTSQANLAFVCRRHHGSPADSNNNLTGYKTNILATLLQFGRMD